MGWDDIDLDKIVSGMITFEGTSDVNFAEYLDILARAIQEKDQITMPEVNQGEGVPSTEIIFTGAPVGSQSFKDNYRAMLGRLKSKINFPWTRSRDNSPNPWYYNSVLSDLNNAAAHEVTQDDFKAAMLPDVYDFLFSEGDLNDIAFDKLWTADILKSIKPALELMQVFIPYWLTSPNTSSPVRPLKLNNLDSINGEASTSIWKFRNSFISSEFATFATYLTENTNPWNVIPISISISERSYVYNVKLRHSAPPSALQNKWRDFGMTFRDRTRLRYKTQDLNSVTIDMEVIPVAKISSNIKRSNNAYGPLTAPFNTNYPEVNPGINPPLNIQTPADSETFSSASGTEKVLSFWQGVEFDPFTPLGGESLANGTYEETQGFGADDETFYVNTNNPALEFYIAPTP